MSDYKRALALAKQVSNHAVFTDGRTVASEEAYTIACAFLQSELMLEEAEEIIGGESASCCGDSNDPVAWEHDSDCIYNKWLAQRKEMKGE